jgi:nucleoside-diphosphate-sugar epimerase
MKLKSSTALVTGGAGFIGSHIVDALLEIGCTVRVLDNLATGRLANLDHVRDRITFLEGDIRDRDMLDKAVSGCQVVFHEAAVVSVPQTVETPIASAMVNDMGTLYVLEASRKQGVKRMVMASSCAVYGDDPELPKNEAMPPCPMSPYAVHKQTGERYGKVYSDLFQMETVCLRYFNVFGPRQDPSSAYSGVISIFMTRATTGEKPLIFGDGSQSRDFVFVKDVVRANLLAASVDGIGGTVFNVGTGESVTILELWQMISQLAGCDLTPDHVSPRPGDIYASLADIGLAGALLGFRPGHAFHSGLKTTFQWYRSGA